MRALRQEGKYKSLNRPDLILLDLNLPLMQGSSFLKWLKADPSLAGIPVIVLSSSSAEQDVAASFAGHAVGYVIKPNNLDGYATFVKGLGCYCAPIEAVLTEKSAASRWLIGELAAQHEMLEVTLKSMGDAVASTDMEGNLIFLNAAAKRLLGLPPSASPGASIAEIERMIEACQPDPALTNADRATLEGTGESLNLPADYALTRRDGLQNRGRRLSGFDQRPGIR